MNKNVLYLIGTSGSGKTSLARSLEKRGFNWIRGAVSRPICLDPFERHVIIGDPRFAVCRNDTYWDRSQIIDFIEQEVKFD